MEGIYIHTHILTYDVTVQSVKLCPIWKQCWCRKNFQYLLETFLPDYLKNKYQFI